MKQSIQNQSLGIFRFFICISEAILSFVCRNARQSRDLSYCLSLLSYTNEKSLHKLIECYRFYAEALADNEVSELFSSILEETRKNAAAAQQPAAATAACLFYIIAFIWFL